MDGIVSSIKASVRPADNLYTVVSDRVVQIRSKLVLDLYDKVSFDMAEADVCGDVEIKGSGKDDYEAVMGRLVDRMGIEANLKKIGLDDKRYSGVISKAMPRLVDAAKTFGRCFASGAPMVIRFHNDGDGTSGATALYRSVMALEEKLFVNERSVLWHMNRSIAYTVESMYGDGMLFGSYRSIEKPLLLITDFGTSPESMDAINRIKDQCELVWLDHHLPYEGFPKDLTRHYMNSWGFGGDSNTTAGLLTCVFAQVISDVDVELLKQSSLISDYSEYADLGNKRAYKLALVMDFLTSGKSRYDSQGTTPKQVESIINDNERFEEVFGFATKLLDEALNVGLKNIRSYRSGPVNVHVLDFSHIAKLGYSYPLPGRYSSKLQAHMEALNNGSTITVIHYGNYISIRESRDISKKIRLLEIIERMKESGDVLSGGGHSEAASIRIGEKGTQEVMKALLTEFGVKAV